MIRGWVIALIGWGWPAFLWATDNPVWTWDAYNRALVIVGEVALSAALLVVIQPWKRVAA
jgi:hypothetical protein